MHCCQPIRSHYEFITIALLLSSVVLVGCGGPVDRLPRVSIHGSVTADGQPVSSGTLSFVPQSRGPATGTPIVGGEYDIESERGPIPGVYQVRLNVLQEKSLAAPPNEPSTPVVFQPTQITVSQDGGELPLAFNSAPADTSHE